MHVMVVLRLVPDTAEDLEIATNAKDIDREWIGFKLNEFDDHALEEAVLLKENSGAKVTAVALDGEGVDRLLQTALARGADHVVKLSHEVASPVPATAAAGLLAAAVKEIGCDLVLTGVQTSEDLFGQLAPSLGAILDWPQVSAVSGIKFEGSTVLVQQEYSGGYASTLSITLPAVVGVQSASKPPRYVSGSKLREVMSAKIATIRHDVAQTPKLSEIMSLGFPERSGKVEMVLGKADAVADRILTILRDRGFVKG